MNRIARKTGLATMALTLSLGMAACGGGDEEPTDTASETTSETPSEEPTEEPTEEEPAASGAADGTFGEGCAAIPTDPSDPGSFEGMATEPVATAASGNPLLKTLVAAVTEAGLVDTLNSAEGITVFAPTDDAFAKIPKDTMTKVMGDKATLTKILTNHVISGKLSPTQIAGDHKTLAGTTITVKGSGTDFTVGKDSAKVLCGNVPTANATVYIIDSVLLP